MGSGGFGTVYRVSFTSGDGDSQQTLHYAVKVQELTAYDKLKKEFDLGKKSKAEYILEYKKSDKNEEILMEQGQFLDKSLASLDQEDKISIVKQLLTQLEYMRRMNIAHRDIKPENIILRDALQADGSKKLVAEFADYGEAIEFKDGDEGIDGEGPYSGKRGTPLYMAPWLRRVDATRKEVESGDLFALGAVLMILSVKHQDSPKQPPYPGYEDWLEDKHLEEWKSNLEISELFEMGWNMRRHGTTDYDTITDRLTPEDALTVLPPRPTALTFTENVSQTPTEGLVWVNVRFLGQFVQRVLWNPIPIPAHLLERMAEPTY